MVSQLLLFMLSFMGVMILGPALALLWGFLFKIDAGRLFAEHRMLVSLAFGFYGALVTFLFFALQDHFIVFRPAPGTPALGKAQLMRLVEESFTKPVEGRRLIEVARSGDRLVVTWDASISYFQGVAAGGRAMKRVVVLSFDETAHRAYFLMKDRDASWSASLGAAEYSLNFSTGLSAEFRVEAYPSIGFSPEGGLRVDLKTLAYNSEELFQPIREAVLGAGWSLHGGMVPGLWHRVLFSLPVALLFLAIGLLVTAMAAHEQSKAVPTPGAAAPRAETPYVVPADLEAQLAQVIPSMKTEMLAAQIEGIVKTPPEHIQEAARRAFAPYLNAYMRRPDRREALVDETLAFAARLKLDGVDAPARAK